MRMTGKAYFDVTGPEELRAAIRRCFRVDEESHWMLSFEDERWEEHADRVVDFIVEGCGVEG